VKELYNSHISGDLTFKTGDFDKALIGPYENLISG